ncbi:MAG: c-type cytochrome [Gammaproteobacteria bacterium]|nr:c-type cytochrome [Gammaproteobacteria bacterium]
MNKAIALLTIYLTLAAAPVQADEVDASAIFHDYCSVCHGDRGDGNSHSKQGMIPPPRDFTSPQSATELNRDRIIHAIKNGVPGTAMTGWKSRLSDHQIEALSDLIETKFMMSSSVSTASEGSRIYAEYCSVCHGDTGKGAVWATAGLSPKPADFTSGKFQQDMTRDHMIQSVSYGRPETAMTGWKNRLSDDQIETVVDYVIDAFMPLMGDKGHATIADKGPDDGHDHSHAHTHADPDTELDVYLGMPLAEGMTGNAERGGNLYDNNCADCHGLNGDGRGPRAYFINPKPRNFLHTASRASFNRPALQRLISKGKLRTEMPAWEKVLDKQQIADISEYVFTTFIQP